MNLAPKKNENKNAGTIAITENFKGSLYRFVIFKDKYDNKVGIENNKL